jgi:hypothetical protein
MSMARNDIERALRDVAAAAENDSPDFSYRLRLTVGHLVEALDALSAYREVHEEVRALISRMPNSAKKHLKVASGSLQKAGPNVLKNARDHTFHYPSPKAGYTPSSDEQLGEAIAALSGRGVEMNLVVDKQAITFTFADDIALAMALGKHADSEADVVRAAESARDGALNFVLWVAALVATYRDVNDLYFGEPTLKPKDPPV